VAQSRPAPAALVIPSDPAFFDTTVCGTSLILRTVCALGKVTTTVHVLKTPFCPDSAPHDVESEINGREFRPDLEWADSTDAIPAENGLLVVSAPGVFDYRLCGTIEALGGDDKIIRCGRSEHQEAPLWFAGKDTARAFLQHLATSSAPTRFTDSPLGSCVENYHPQDAVCEIISDEQSRRLAEKKLLIGARKESDTFIANHFDRRISNWLTRRVIQLPVTPNQLTVLNTGLGITGAALLLMGTYGAQLCGSFLLLLSIIFDGCDGEVARLKFLESTFGGKLDFFLDNVVNSFAIFATGAGYYLQNGDRLYLAMALVNTALALAAVPPVYLLFFRRLHPSIDPGPPKTKALDARSVAEGISGRDFIYLIFFLAVFGKVHWFPFFGVAGLSIFVPTVCILVVVQALRAKANGRTA